MRRLAGALEGWRAELEERLDEADDEELRHFAGQHLSGALGQMALRLRHVEWEETRGAWLKSPTGELKRGGLVFETPRKVEIVGESPTGGGWRVALDPPENTVVVSDVPVHWLALDRKEEQEGRAG